MDHIIPPFLYPQNEDLISSTNYYPPQPYAIEYDQQYGATQDSYINPHNYDSFSGDLYYNNNNCAGSAEEESNYYYKNLDISNYLPYKVENDVTVLDQKVKNENSASNNNYESEATVSLDYLNLPDGKLTSNHVKSLSQLCPPYPESGGADSKQEGRA